MDIEIAVRKYRKTFKENFPCFLCMGLPDEEMIAIIEKCLKENKPYRPKIHPEAMY